MNSDILSVNTTKYEKVKKGHNAQIYRHNNPNNLQIIRGISDAHQVVDNPNQSTKQEQKLNSSLAPTSHTSSTSTKNISSITGKYQTRKLVDSKQASRTFHQSDKKAFPLDTYARIAASNNRRCSKHLRELAKPKKQIHSDQSDCSTNFDLNYHHATKIYGTENKHILKESRKK